MGTDSAPDAYPRGRYKEPIMAKNTVSEIRKATRRKFSAEQKIRIILEGLLGEIPVSEPARREGIAPSVYYRWSKDFLEAGKNGLTRGTNRANQQLCGKTIGLSRASCCRLTPTIA